MIIFNYFKPIYDQETVVKKYKIMPTGNESVALRLFRELNLVQLIQINSVKVTGRCYNDGESLVAKYWPQICVYCIY